MKTPIALLPFVQLQSPSILEMGPITFSPASQEECQKHLKSLNLNPQDIIAISIDSDIDPKEHTRLLHNAIFLLYFGLNFHELYHDIPPPRFAPFGLVIPLNSPAGTLNYDYTPHKHVIQTDRQQVLAKLGEKLTSEDQRLVQSIRFFVDRLKRRFSNPLQGEACEVRSFAEPETAIFLTTSFESLFELDPSQLTGDLKKMLRPLFGLEYSRSVEMLWAWIDGFLMFRQNVIQGKPLDPVFRGNPNYEIPYLYLGIKSFLFAVAEEIGLEDEFDKREILSLFWPVDALLERIDYSLNKPSGEQDAIALQKLYICAYRTWIEPKSTGLSPVRYIPSHEYKLEPTPAMLPEFVTCL